MKPSIALSLAAATLGVAALAFSMTARAEDAPPASGAADKMGVLEAQVTALKAQVDYLRSREAALTSALLSHEKAAGNIHNGTGNARAEGFEAAAISANSRIAVLATLDNLATDLASSVPKPTTKEVDLRRKADDLVSKAWTK